MDFRTEWSSWLMVIVMMGLTVAINPWVIPEVWTAGSTFRFIVNLLAYPLIATALATIPVLLVCWILKVEPDLDYSIRTAFVFMLFVLVSTYFF